MLYLPFLLIYKRTSILKYESLKMRGSEGAQAKVSALNSYYVQGINLDLPNYHNDWHDCTKTKTALN